MAEPIILKRLNPQPNEDTYFVTIFSLDGKRYGFKFYNTGTFIQPSSWYMDVYNVANDDTVVAGIRMGVGISMLEPYRYKGTSLIPPGQVIVSDLRTLVFDTETQTFLTQPGFDPSTDSFQDDTHTVYYVPEALLNG